ncbi:winged helix-turn-helix domain-containing protein [Vibrio gallicus]|uniref:winged helix-turn-helix domain-containing protein n=1 Tax=Vibrio gallicus TaxID=190897 RepID=UPI0021C2FC31|nr:transcriptional regulator [Vibrio gallicus]
MSNIGIKYILAQKYIFDPNNNSLVEQHAEDTITRLGSNESRILTLLCDKPNEVITRDQLHEFVWRDQGFQVDDSSLTQAISTLRRMLKDSTKSPQFVKTVPKRGYQLICSVERTTPSAVVEEQPKDIVLESPLSQIANGAQANLKESKPKPESKKSSLWARLDIQTRVMLAFALALPIIAIFIPNSAPSAFRDVTSVADIQVKTIEGHPTLEQWLPSIKMCVESYINAYPDDSDPVEVIATASQDNQLYLNYIHAPEFTDKNSTVRLIADQSDLRHICSPKKENNK